MIIRVPNKRVGWNKCEVLEIFVIYLGEKETLGEIFFFKKNKRAYTFIRHLRNKMVVEYFDGGVSKWRNDKLRNVGCIFTMYIRVFHNRR